MWCATGFHFFFLNLYINDMQNSVSCKLMLYADDSILLVPGNNVTYISNSLQLQLGLIRDWLAINKLSLHIGKTESILFGTKRKLNNCEKLNVICDGNLTSAVLRLECSLDCLSAPTLWRYDVAV